MHHSAMEYGRLFFSQYTKENSNLKIVDIGSQDVNGSLRSVTLKGNDFIGVDFVEGKGVDVIINDPYNLPFSNDSVDVVVCSSCFEHSEFFWLLFNDIIRILKPGGLFYLNVPSNGNFHRYPVDCWRFYPDSGVALQNWAIKNGFDVILLESFIGGQDKAIWNDFIAVFLKDSTKQNQHPNRITDKSFNFYNKKINNDQDIHNYKIRTEDQSQSIISFIIKRIFEKYDAFTIKYFKK
jgi:SAM-dependent methyltransferase